MKTGTVKKTVLTFYEVILKNGKKIRLTDDQVNQYSILDGQKIFGNYRTVETQNRYTNGEYARSYSIQEYFDIDKVDMENK